MLEKDKENLKLNVKIGDNKLFKTQHYLLYGEPFH